VKERCGRWYDPVRDLVLSQVSEGLSASGFRAIFQFVVQTLLQIRSAGRHILPLGMLLIGALASLQSSQAAESRPVRPEAFVVDGAPEPATFALIGGALCLVSFRLRRLKK
jgi:hypothetical protein